MRLTMARQTVKRLYDLEIDEISLVDRGANQHATVAIAKRDEDESMGIYDADGYEVEETELEHGDVVYDDAGTEYVFVEDNPDDGTTDSLEEYEEEDSDQLVGVGKSLLSQGKAFVRAGTPGHHFPEGKDLRAARAGQKMRRGATRLMEAGRDRGNQRRAGAAGLVAATAGGAGYANGRRSNMRKSLGEEVYEELSKALNSGDRDEVIAKAMDTVEVYKAQAEDAWNLAANLADERDNAHFLEVAKSYQLPVQPEVIAEIIKSASATMPAAHVEALDQIFSSVGEQLYAEIGANGGYAGSETMEMIQALAGQHVGKSDLSQEQAIVALFDANPDAYDTYITEKG